ncbi:MAG: hypothetical protein ACRD1T_08335, partial [Acidimicrobiia bacterium]
AETRKRLMLGLCSLLVSANRRDKMAVSLKPSTLLRFHQALVRAKYRRLESAIVRDPKDLPKTSLPQSLR